MAVGRQEHIALAFWAADCAEHVLPLFERQHPDDDRPRKAIEAARLWARGDLRCGEARKAASAAHAAARATAGAAAVAAARAAGHAAATAHVPTHAEGAAGYAVKAAVAAAAETAAAETEAAEERAWQEQRLLGRLPALPALRAVGFDLGDTLIEYEGVRLDWQHEFPAALAEIASACSRSPSEEQLAAAVGVLLGANTRVTARRHELDYREVFGGVVDALGLDVADELGGCACGRSDLIERSVDAFFVVFRRKLHAMPGATDLLDRLGSLGIPVWVLTDVPYGMPRRLVLEDLEAAGLSRLAPVTTTSVEVGARKPAPEGFYLLAERLDVPAARVWFVGNEQRDIAGAKAAGMTAVLLWRSAEPAPAWGQDLLVTRLEDIGSILSECPPSREGR